MTKLEEKNAERSSDLARFELKQAEAQRERQKIIKQDAFAEKHNMLIGYDGIEDDYQRGAAMRPHPFTLNEAQLRVLLDLLREAQNSDFIDAEPLKDCRTFESMIRGYLCGANKDEAP